MTSIYYIEDIMNSDASGPREVSMYGEGEANRFNIELYQTRDEIEEQVGNGQYLPPVRRREYFRHVQRIMENKLLWLSLMTIWVSAEEDNVLPQEYNYIYDRLFGLVTFMYLLVPIMLYMNRFETTAYTLVAVVSISSIARLFEGAPTFLTLWSYPFLRGLSTSDGIYALLVYSALFIIVYLVYQIIVWWVSGRKWSLDNPYKACSEIQYRFASRQKFYEETARIIYEHYDNPSILYGKQMSDIFVTYFRDDYHASQEAGRLFIYKINGEDRTPILVEKDTYFKWSSQPDQWPSHIRAEIDALLNDQIWKDNEHHEFGQMDRIKIGDCRPDTQKTRMPVITRMQNYRYNLSERHTWFYSHSLRRITNESASDKTVLLCKNMMEDVDISLARNAGDMTLSTITNYMSKRENYLIDPREQTDQLLHIPRREIIRYKIIAARESDKLDQMDEDIADFQGVLEASKWKRVWRNTDRRIMRTIRTSPMLSMVCHTAVFLKLLVLIMLMAVVYLLYSGNLYVSPDSFKQDGVDVVFAQGEIYGENMNFEPKRSGKPTKDGFRQLKQGQTIKEPTWTFIPKDSCLYNDSLQGFDLHDARNKDAAITERVASSNITCRYEPDWDMMEQIADEIAEELRPKMRALDDVFNPQNIKDYILARPGYTSAQKRNILKSFEDLEGDTYQNMLQFCRYKAFIKDEMYPKNNRPRAIMACADLLKVLGGAVFGEFGEALFSQEYCIKLKAIGERPAYCEEVLRGAGNFVYQTDHTAFESAATKEMQQHVELRIYKKIYPELAWLFDYMAEDQVISTGYGQEASIFYVPASRWSGAPNTSLGNTIMNVVFIRMMERNFDVKTKYLVEGDDALVVSQTELNVEEVRRYAETQGFDLKMEQKEDISTAGFLSTVWDPKDLKPDVQTRWRYLYSNLIFRDSKVAKIGFWSLLSARLLASAYHIPKSPLVIDAFTGALYFSRNRVCIERTWWNVEYFKNVLGATLVMDSDDCMHAIGYDTSQLDLTGPDIQLDLVQYAIPMDLYLEIKRDLLSGDVRRYFKGYVKMLDVYYDREYEYASNYGHDKTLYGKVKHFFSTEVFSLKFAWSTTMANWQEIQQLTNTMLAKMNSKKMEKEEGRM